MSVSELLVPNTLDLFANNLTAQSVTAIALDVNDLFINHAHTDNSPIEIKGRQFGATVVDNCIGLQSSINIPPNDDFQIQLLRNVGSTDLNIQSPSSSNILFLQGSSGNVCLNTTTPAAGGYLLTVAGNASLGTLTTTNGVSFPNTSQSGNGIILSVFQTDVIGTTFTTAINPTSSNLRFSRVGKTVNLSIDGIGPQVLISLNPITSLVSVPAIYLPLFINSATGIVLPCSIRYFSSATPVVDIQASVIIQSNGAITIKPVNIPAVNSATEIGFSPFSNFSDTSSALPANATIEWSNINVSWYAAS